MIRKLMAKPDHMEDNAYLPEAAEELYYQWTVLDQDYYIRVVLMPEGAAIHMEPVEWTPSLAKAAEGDWFYLVNDLKNRHGVKVLFAATQEENRALFDKFIGAFGFKPTNAVYVSRQEVV